MTNGRPIEFYLSPGDHARFRKAAKVRGLSLRAFLLESSRAVADDTLAPVRHGVDGFERRPTTSYADPRR